MNFTEQYNKELFNRVTSYRSEVLNFLKVNNNHFGTINVNFEVNNKKINYLRWMHPNQGDWEIDYLFNSYKLECVKKLIRPNSVVLDIGAHTGNMSVAYSLFADKVISFEPNPVTFEILENNSKLNTNIVPYNFACSNEEGELEFHYSDPGYNNGGYAVKLDAGIGVTGHSTPIEVYGINVGEFLSQTHPEDIDNISYIKIDCEGHDKEILPTLRTIINKNKPIIQTEIYDGLSRREKIELIQVMSSLNYDCYNFTDASDDIDKISTKITEEGVASVSLLSGHNLICFPRSSDDTK